jgi:carboxyl-terminal processing protease
VDGQEVRRLSVGHIGSLVRGKAGATVRLLLSRPGQSKPFELKVERGQVDVPDVRWQMLPGPTPVAHVSFQRFGKNSQQQLHDALLRAKEQKARGLILDLRGNPGGLKEQAIAVASDLLPEDKVVLVEQNAKGRRQEIRARGKGAWSDNPLVVLIDGGSASSSEIVAGALQDNQRAKLVGTRTFGTGTVLREYPLSDGSAVLLAISLWLTPQGRQIWRQGIAPDVGVSLPAGANMLLPDDQTVLTPERFAGCGDTQLHKAYEVLLQQIR